MTFASQRDIERQISYHREHIEISEKAIADLERFLEEPRPRERPRERVIKEPRRREEPRSRARGPSEDNKKWREDPISDRQVAFMEKNNIEFWDGMSKGEASDAIDKFIKSKQKGGR